MWPSVVLVKLLYNSCYCIHVFSIFLLKKALSIFVKKTFSLSEIQCYLEGLNLSNQHYYMYVYIDIAISILTACKISLHCMLNSIVLIYLSSSNDKGTLCGKYIENIEEGFGKC